MDKATLIGLSVAGVGIVGGMLLEGGSLMQITQPTAALIVIGGTIGAAMVQFPLHTVKAALASMARVFFEKKVDANALIATLLEYAKVSRKEGILALEKHAAEAPDPFLRKALSLAVDGTSPQDLRAILEIELDYHVEHDEKIPQFWEAAGGYAPTIGIIGAVMGLIQVMQHLDNIEEVGHGIAVAFVATIYGVATANLLFLPAAGKLKIRLAETHLLQTIALEGVVSLAEGLNPHLIETKLRGFVGGGGGGEHSAEKAA
jgi:chemotaxis protein MotA